MEPRGLLCAPGHGDDGPEKGLRRWELGQPCKPSARETNTLRVEPHTEKGLLRAASKLSRTKKIKKQNIKIKEREKGNIRKGEKRRKREREGGGRGGETGNIRLYFTKTTKRQICSHEAQKVALAQLPLERSESSLQVKMHMKKVVSFNPCKVTIRNMKAMNSIPMGDGGNSRNARPWSTCPQRQS